MKLVRFFYKKKNAWGAVRDGAVRVLSGQPFGSLRYSGVTVPLAKVKPGVPATPSKIVLVGLNYRRHARELKMNVPRDPILFLKPPTTLAACGEAIEYPRGVRRLDYEGELALVIGKKIKSIKPKAALRAVLGYTCLNDVTARDIQKKDRQWTRAKSFDTFCPLGPYLVTGKKGPFRIRTYLNGRVRQDSGTDDFIFSIEYLVWFISNVMTLYPGDVISTGTPSGVGSMRPGDTVSVEIDGIGTLTNPVKRAE